MNDHYDIILVGSGMGALTAADAGGLGVTGAIPLFFGRHRGIQEKKREENHLRKK
jgi:thioredoxin reductase